MKKSYIQDKIISFKNKIIFKLSKIFRKTTTSSYISNDYTKLGKKLNNQSNHYQVQVITHPSIITISNSEISKTNTNNYVTYNINSTNDMYQIPSMYNNLTLYRYNENSENIFTPSIKIDIEEEAIALLTEQKRKNKIQKMFEKINVKNATDFLEL